MVKKNSKKRRQKIPMEKAAMSKRELQISRRRVVRTRNGGTWTEAEYWQKIRGALRNLSRWWVVARKAKEKCRRKYSGTDKRIKWEYKCSHCSGFFVEKMIAVHHKIQVGSLNNSKDLEGFVDRLFTENVDDYEVLCHPCHLDFHKKEKEKTI